MINVYSPSQLFAQLGKKPTMNIELPKWKGNLEYMNPYDVMCLIAAGCTDGRYDGLCSSLIGMDEYLSLFSLWRRTRSDITY